MKRLNFCFVAFLALSSCATIDSVERGSGQIFVVKGAEYSKVWRAANAVVARQLTVVSVDKSSGTIKAEKGAGMASWGEVVGVFITPPGDSSDNSFQIEVVSMKRSKMQITGQDWKQTVIQGIKAELGVD